MSVWLCVVLVLVHENYAFHLGKVQDLGIVNDLALMKFNISLFGYGIQGLFETNAVPSCDKFIIFKAEGSGIKIRGRPKGICHNCCPIESKDIRLLLYTNQHPDIPIRLPLRRRKRSKHFSLSKLTKIAMYVHGFLEVPEVGTSQLLKNAYLSRNENYAFIVVDWSNLTSFPWYNDAIVNAHYTATVLARFFESYSDGGVISLENVQILGFSLGAQTAGFIGKYLRSDLKIGRITGLDPAFPGFNDETGKYRISRTDADFVDIIHTDGGNYGYISPLGHVDFYPNDGTSYQPGCGLHFLQSRNRFGDIFSCSHNLVYKLYVESVYSPYNFPAVKCIQRRKGGHICNKNNIAYMGLAANKNNSGSYYLKTNMEPPYGRSAFDIRSNEW